MLIDTMSRDMHDNIETFGMVCTTSGRQVKGSYKYPSTPILINNQANQLTFLDSSFQVASPTSLAFVFRLLTSAPNAFRNDGEEVMRSNDSSVSYFNERLDRLEDPTKVKNGLAGPGGDIQIPAY
jgi:hypothetical protein